jgi:hypothetical protein
MFTYMTPLMSGASREFSKPFDHFWCCVGSGIESHAKHGDSIYWEGDDTLFVNLYIPSELQWRSRGATLTLETTYPTGENTTLRVTKPGKKSRFAVALRIPGWAKDATVLLNGKPVEAKRESGYAIVSRRWKAGDALTLTLPLALRIESTTDDPDTIAILRGPVVLAADLGAGESDLTRFAPVLVGANVLAGFQAVDGAPSHYSVSEKTAKPEALKFAPFFSLHEQRTAVYFRRFTEDRWQAEQVAFIAAQEKQRELAARSVDVMHLGEMQPERDHNLTSAISYPVSYRGLNGRDARSQGFFEFDVKVAPGTTLQATYWGDERKREFEILIDGRKLASQTLNQDHPGQFFDVDYPIPDALIKGKKSVRVRFQPIPRNTAGPVFGVKIFRSK